MRVKALEQLDPLVDDHAPLVIGQRLRLRAGKKVLDGYRWARCIGRGGGYDGTRPECCRSRRGGACEQSTACKFGHSAPPSVRSGAPLGHATLHILMRPDVCLVTLNVRPVPPALELFSPRLRPARNPLHSQLARDNCVVPPRIGAMISSPMRRTFSTVGMILHSTSSMPRSSNRRSWRRTLSGEPMQPIFVAGSMRLSI